jgi:hypothetical protein
VRKILSATLGLWLAGLLVATAADTYQLADGTTISGDIVSFTDKGIIFRQGEDKYIPRMSWLKFSQAGLNQLAQNPKIEPLVEPFIEAPPAPHPQVTDVKVREVQRLERPAVTSLFGAVFSTSFGFVALLLVYAANLFAGYQVALFRSKPMAMVMGVSALLPVIGPIIFLSMIPPPPQTEEAVAAEGAPTEQTAGETSAPGTHIPPAGAGQKFAMPGAQPQQAEGIHVIASSWQASPSAEKEPSKPQIYQRGMFMFNRRFFETKFPGFFPVVRVGSDKDKLMTVKTLKEQMVVERITRIAANDVHFEVTRGGVRNEVMVPFAEIQEIQISHKEA